MATTAAEVLVKAKDLHPDAITLDLLIPGAEAWNTLRDLRQTPETARIPVLVVSVMDEPRISRRSCRLLVNRWTGSSLGTLTSTSVLFRAIHQKYWSLTMNSRRSSCYMRCWEEQATFQS